MTSTLSLTFVLFVALFSAAFADDCAPKACDACTGNCKICKWSEQSFTCAADCGVLSGSTVAPVAECNKLTNAVVSIADYTVACTTPTINKCEKDGKYFCSVAACPAAGLTALSDCQADCKGCTKTGCTYCVTQKDQKTGVCLKLTEECSTVIPQSSTLVVSDAAKCADVKSLLRLADATAPCAGKRCKTDKDAFFCVKTGECAEVGLTAVEAPAKCASSTVCTDCTGAGCHFCGLKNSKVGACSKDTCAASFDTVLAKNCATYANYYPDTKPEDCKVGTQHNCTLNSTTTTFVCSSKPCADAGLLTSGATYGHLAIFAVVVAICASMI